MIITITPVYNFFDLKREYEKKSVNSWRFHGSGKISGFYICRSGRIIIA